MRRIVLSLAGLLALVAGLGVARASEPQAPSPPFTELEVVEQGFQSLGDAGGDIGLEVRWGVLVHNPNPDTWVAGAGTVDVTFLDADGNVVGTDYGNSA